MILGKSARSVRRSIMPSPAMVVAILSLLVALSGSAYAAAKINGKNIKTGTVTSKQVKNNSLTGGDIKSGSIAASDLAATVGTIGPKGDKGDPGTTGAANVVTHRHNITGVTSGNGASGEASCASGERAVGGGGIWVNELTSNILSSELETSYPLTNHSFPSEGQTPNGWTAGGSNPTGATSTLAIYVICVSQ